MAKSSLEWQNVTVGEFATDKKANAELTRLWKAREAATAAFEDAFTAHAIKSGALIEGEAYAFAYRHGGLGVAQKSAATARRTFKL